MYRQGDLILVPTAAVQADGSTRLHTLAVGEESGHSHVIEGLLPEPGVLVLPEPALLRVAGMPWRHDAIDLPAGSYAFWVQRELSEDDEVRYVAD